MRSASQARPKDVFGVALVPKTSSLGFGPRPNFTPIHCLPSMTPSQSEKGTTLDFLLQCCDASPATLQLCSLAIQAQNLPGSLVHVSVYIQMRARTSSHKCTNPINNQRVSTKLRIENILSRGKTQEQHQTGPPSTFQASALAWPTGTRETILHWHAEERMTATAPRQPCRCQG